MSSSETLNIVLDGLLNDWYTASVLGHGNIADVTLRYYQMKEIHPNLPTEAAKRFDALKNIDPMRCFLSNNQRQFFERVLK